MSLDIENTILTPESSKDHGRSAALPQVVVGNELRLIQESMNNDEMVMMAMSREGQGKITMSPRVPQTVNKQSTHQNV